MRKFIRKSNERILCKLSKSDMYSIVHVAMETTKPSHFTCRSKSFISIFFTCQLSACELQPFSCHDLTNDIYSQTAKTVLNHLKKWICAASDLSSLFHAFNSSNVGKFFWTWILKDCIKVEEKKKKVVVCLFPFSTKRDIRQFHVVVVQRRQRNVQKSVMHVQSCCFACLNLLLFCCTRCHRRRGCVNSLISPPSHLHFGE